MLNKLRLVIALAVSYYVWDLMAHAFFVSEVALFLFSVRGIGSLITAASGGMTRILSGTWT
jgi:hypothetical protein